MVLEIKTGAFRRGLVGGGASTCIHDGQEHLDNTSPLIIDIIY